ncbi:MAG: cytochrome c biogenesis protein CcsA [Gammaproteobacteria bacterium]|nr:cytochrome c biogenesis protein CcsA [Gammaproteobacteria bacterium]
MWIATISAYALAALLQALALPCPRTEAKWLSVFLGLVAVCLHALMLHTWIDLPGGQNLNFFNLLSLGLWLVAIIVIVMEMFKSVEILAVIALPLAAISIVLAHSFPQILILRTSTNLSALFHIILSILTFSVLCVAGLFAVLLWLQDIALRYRPSSVLINKLPPLQTVEHLLFQAIAFGFVLLTVLLVSSFYFYHDLLWQQTWLWSKSLLAIIAWLIFLILLIGRWRLGWRGRKVIIYTLTALVLLVVVYLGSRYLLQVMQKWI